jgi:thioredoxin 1
MKTDLRVTDKDFEKEVLDEKSPVLVDFWGSWCIPSQMMMPVLDLLSDEYGGRAKVRKLNVDQNPQMRERYNILGCPTFILFLNGEEVARKVGAQSVNQLREMIDSAREGTPE